MDFIILIDPNDCYRTMRFLSKEWLTVSELSLDEVWASGVITVHNGILHVGLTSVLKWSVMKR